jgi:predicted acetylornithine/succinylornithine family transaminase
MPSRIPIVLVEGKGAVLRDLDGREYIDCFSGIAVTNIGHCHPRVVMAVKEQAAKLMHVSGLYYNIPMAKLAEKLAQISIGGLKKSFFCNSGAEAVEGAIKLAKKYAVRHGKIGSQVISLECSFHGRTALTLTITGQKKYKTNFGNFANVPGVVHAPAPYCYRCPFKYPECDIWCARSLEDIIETNTTGDIAAFIAEPILGEGGIIVPPDEYLPLVQKICKEHEILFIADEIQTGFGRTGKMFASEHWNIQPDIITMAKGLGGGLPIGAFMANDEIASAFSPGDHFSTFGGNPVCCAAALANIEALIEERIPEKAAELGKYAIERLNELAQKYKIIGDVRGKGLMIGVELVKDRESKTPAQEEAVKIREKMLEKGVLIGVGGLKKSTLRIQPCLTITKEQIDKALDALESTIK